MIPPKSNLIIEIEVVKVITPNYKNIDSLQFKIVTTDNSFKILDIRIEDDIKKSGKIPNFIIFTAFDKNENFNPIFINLY